MLFPGSSRPRTRRRPLAALDRRHLVEAACSRIAAVEARCCRALGALCARGSDVASGEGWAGDVAALACRGRVGDAPATQKVLSGEHAGALHWRPPSSLQEAWRESVKEALAASPSPLRNSLMKTSDASTAVANAVAASRRDASLLPLALLAASSGASPDIADAASRGSADARRRVDTPGVRDDGRPAQARRLAGRLPEVARDEDGRPASRVAPESAESISARYSFDAGDVAFLDDQGALAVDLEAIAPLIEGDALKKLFGEARRVFPLAPAPLLRVVAHTSETATGDLRKVPYGARLAVCTETTALTLSEDGAPAWAPARIDDVANAAQKTPYRRTRPSLLAHQMVRWRSRTRGAGSTLQNSRNLWCAWGGAILL